MTFTSKEIRVLAACEMNADLSMQEIADRAGVKLHVARYILTDLIERGLITRRAYINSYLLGTFPFHLLFSLSSDYVEHKDKIIEFMKQQPEISFVAELAGAVQCWAEARAQNAFELEEIFYRISERFGDVFQEKEILIMPWHADLPVVVPTKLRTQAHMFETRDTDKKVKLDSSDCRILEVIAKNWEMSNQALARIVELPNSTVDYRLKNMRDSGLIIGSRFYLNFPRSDKHHFVHFGALRGLSSSLRERFRAFALKEECVWIVRSFVGRWDFMFETHHSLPNESLDFAARLHHTFPKEIVLRQTVPVLQFSKVSDCTTPRSIP